MGVENKTSEVNHHDSEAAEEKTPFLIVHPHSNFSLVWNVLVLLFLIYFVFSVPYEMCFITTQFEKSLEDCQQATRSMMVHLRHRCLNLCWTRLLVLRLPRETYSQL